MESCHLLFRMVVNRFPTHEVRAIGQKSEGSDGSTLAEVFAMNLMTAFFHVDGTEEVDQLHSNISCRLSTSEGHFLKMV